MGRTIDIARRRLPRLLAVGVALGVALAAAGERRAHAEADAESRERCAVRLSIALRGTAPDAALLAASDPKAELDRLMATPEFIDRFAAFVNTTFNDEPEPLASRDPAYFLAREIIGKKLPWSDLFLGQYEVAIPDGESSQSDPVVTASPDGLGYFRVMPWMVRYVGNEAEGIRIATAYRIMNNVIGLELMPVTTADGVDISSTGRAASACRGCHFDGPFALDKIARALPRAERAGGGRYRFNPSPDGPQTALGGVTIASDKDLVSALVASENFSFNACRLVFRYLYGRPEHTCEAPVFDACVDAFKAKRTIQAAITAVVSDPGFCQ